MILFSLILQVARGDLVIRQVIEHRCLRADSTQSKSSCSILVRGPSNIHTNYNSSFAYLESSKLQIAFEPGMIAVLQT